MRLEGWPSEGALEIVDILEGRAGILRAGMGCPLGHEGGKVASVLIIMGRSGLQTNRESMLLVCAL